MLQEHQTALEKVDESFHTFMLRYRATAKTVFGFVEGKDDPSFYLSIIERFIPDDWKLDLIICGNKDKVFRTYKSFDWNRFDEKQISFFIDRDVDELVMAYLPRGGNLYTTDSYSIENTIVNSATFIRLLGEAYSIIDAEENERDSLIREFDDDLSYFCACLIPVMAQIVLWRLDRQKAYQNEIDLGEIFHFPKGRIKLRDAYTETDDLVQKFADMVGASVSDAVERQRIADILLRVDEQMALTRGKFLLWFLANHLHFTHQNVAARLAAYDRPPKAKNPLGPKTVGFAAAPRTRIPVTLRAFVQRNYVAFIDKRLGMQV